MRKFALFFLFSILIVSVQLKINAQVVAVKNDSIPIRDSVVFVKLSNFVGNIQWEKSADGQEWSAIPNETADSIAISTKASSFYRAKVTVNHCDSFFSDTTQFLKGEITPVKTDIKPNEICILKTKNVVVENSDFSAKINGQDVELISSGNYIFFLMPELAMKNPQFDLVINGQKYSFKYSLGDPIPDSALNRAFSDYIASSTQLIIDLENKVYELVKLDSINEGLDYYQNFLNVLDSLKNDIIKLFDEISPEEIALLNVIIASNPLLFDNHSLEMKSLSLISSVSEEFIPEAELEKLPGILLEKSEELDAIASQASSVLELVVDYILGEVVEKVFEKIIGTATKLTRELMDVNDKKEIMNSYLQIKELISTTKATVRNPTYVHVGKLYQYKKFEFVSDESQEINFTSEYRQLTLEDQARFTNIKMALENFNKSFKQANELLLHQLFIGLGLPTITDSYPIAGHENEPYTSKYFVDNRYIASTNKDIEGSISNSNVKLVEYSKSDVYNSNLKFQNLTNEVQEFTFNMNYKHAGYNESTTTFTAKVDPSVSGLLINMSPWKLPTANGYGLITFSEGIVEMTWYRDGELNNKQSYEWHIISENLIYLDRNYYRINISGDAMTMSFLCEDNPQYGEPCNNVIWNMSSVD
ncbi:MAG: hypothetical protein R2757_16785 [Draconibacterium sp.]